MKATLTIDTSNNKEVVVGLEINPDLIGINGSKEIVKQPLDTRKAQAVLPMVEELLKKHKLELKDLTEIKVNPGPGSFTGVRVGVSIANALGLLLNIPINGKAVGEFVEPEY